MARGQLQHGSGWAQNPYGGAVRLRSTGGGEITWTIATKVACPPVHEPKRPHWSRMQDELLSSPWDLLLCSAGSLSAILCTKAAEVGRKAMDVGALDQRIIKSGRS